MAASERTLTDLAGPGDFATPRWHEGRWWLTDPDRRAVVTVDPEGGEQVVFEAPVPPAGLGWLPDGTLLFGSTTDRQVLRHTGRGEITVHGDASQFAPHDVHDVVVDDQGWAWVTGFGYDVAGGGDPVPANLVRLHPDGHASMGGDRLALPSGIAVTSERFLIVAEALGSRFTAFTVATDGTLEDRRIWAQLAPEPGTQGMARSLAELDMVPFGAAPDAEGSLWCTDVAGRRALRISSGGNFLDEVPAPDGLTFFACALGGDDGRTLLLCAAPPPWVPGGSSARDVVLFVTEVTVPHDGHP
jgi:sugar lactone lactonase YvrE